MRCGDHLRLRSRATPRRWVPSAEPIALWVDMVALTPGSTCGVSKGWASEFVLYRQQPMKQMNAQCRMMDQTLFNHGTGITNGCTVSSPFISKQFKFLQRMFFIINIRHAAIAMLSFLFAGDFLSGGARASHPPASLGLVKKSFNLQPQASHSLQAAH